MGKEYRSEGGIGIKLTEDQLNTIVKTCRITRDHWEENTHNCREATAVRAEIIGDEWTGKTTWCLFVEGTTLYEISVNTPKMLKSLRRVGLYVKQQDLKLINGLYVY